MLKKLLGGIILGATMLVASGCGQKIENADNTLYFIPIVDTGAYWSVMRTGAENMAAELGWDIVVRTTPPAEPSKNERHLSFVQEAITNGVAGIAVAPIDPNMFDRQVRDASEAGIPVVTFDADIATSTNRISYVGTDNFLAGQELGRRGAQYLQQQGITEGSVAMVTFSLTQSTSASRQAGIKAGFEDQMGAGASSFTWLPTIADDDQASVSMQQLEGQIVANPDMVAVFSLGSEGPTHGTMSALRSQNMGGIIHHFGFDFTPTWLEGVQDGLIVGIVDQDAYEIGRQVIRTLVDAAEGREVQENYPIPVQWVLAADIEALGLEKESLMGEETVD